LVLCKRHSPERVNPRSQLYEQHPEWAIAERKATTAAIVLYKQSLRDIVLQGELYRLDSPYEQPRSAISYVTPNRARAALFVYQIKDAADQPVKLRGLDPAAQYLLREVNLPDGAVSRLPADGKTLDGATLMRDGLAPNCQK
jgi:alpha-galactosidase